MIRVTGAGRKTGKAILDVLARYCPYGDAGSVYRQRAGEETDE